MENKEIEIEYTIGQWIKDNDIDTTKDIECSNQGITSLDGLPEGFNSNINSYNNNLTSLKGLPKGFNSEIDCSHNNLTSLEGVTNLEPKNLNCDWDEEQIEAEYRRLGLGSLLI